MNLARIFLAAAVGIAALIGFAPTAHADRLACAWVDPHGVCISNPIPNLPRLPRVPSLP